MFVPGKHFQPSVIFASKARAYPSEALFRCTTLGQAPGLNHKDYTKQEMVARDKHKLMMSIRKLRL